MFTAAATVAPSLLHLDCGIDAILTPSTRVSAILQRLIDDR